MTRTEFNAIDALEEACRDTDPQETIDICDSVIAEAERIKMIAEDELEEEE